MKNDKLDLSDLPEGKIKVRFGHSLFCDGTVTPLKFICLYCKQSWSSFYDVPNEDCPGKKYPKE